MKHPVEKLALPAVPEEGEVGGVAGRQEVNMGARSEACKKGLRASERSCVKGVNEEVEGLRRRVAAEVGKDCVEDLGRCRREFRSESVGEGASDCGEDGARC